MKKAVILILVVMAAVLLARFTMAPGGYAVRVVCLMLLAATLGQCWNIVGGLANQVSLGHAAFFGIGAYASTVLQLRWGISPWLGIPVGMLLAAVVALLLSIPTMRLKGPYFALATLAFGEACRIAAVAMAGVTGGPQGISIPFLGDSWAMLQFRGAGGYLPVLVGMFAVACLAFAALAGGATGYRMRAIRENEDAAEVAGIDTLRIKLTASIVSAALTATTGSTFAQFTFFFDPDSVFSVSGISIRAALIAIVGGAGSLSGPVIGAIVVVAAEEALNTYMSDQAAGIAPFMFGLVLIAIVLLRPKGLISVLPARWGQGGRK